MSPNEILAAINAFAPDLVAIRRDIHKHPETRFEEVRTSALVARKLRNNLERDGDSKRNHRALGTPRPSSQDGQASQAEVGTPRSRLTEASSPYARACGREGSRSA